MGHVIANGRIATNGSCCAWSAGRAVTVGPCQMCSAAPAPWFTNAEPQTHTVSTAAPLLPLNRAARRKAAALARRKK